MSLITKLVWNTNLIQFEIQTKFLMAFCRLQSQAVFFKKGGHEYSNHT